MKRSRLRNIIDKSKTLPVGEFDRFKQSLPKDLRIDENYRLEAAWKAYGSPKDYKEAIWNGMIQLIDETTSKLPSIGYNEQTEEYEYLNKGRDNETVAKDIRVWDNDVIPFVQELKQGGYVRTFDEENGFWKYSKNPQVAKIQERSEEIIEQFKQGGKKSYSEWIKTVPEDRLNDNYDLEKAYEYLPIEELEKWRTATSEQLNDESYHLKSVAPDGEDYIFLKKGREWINPEVQAELNQYFSGKTGLQFSHDLIFDEDQNRYFYRKKKGYDPKSFKHGGQVNLIPDGALHAHKNHMELAEKGEITAKGIPVIDNNGEQQAEIEREEWTMSKELTEDVEKWYKAYYNDDTSNKEKDELAIKCGKRITEELLHNTDDRANLISKLMEDE